MMNPRNHNRVRSALSALARTCRRFRRKEDGTSAVEFGFVAAPFLGLGFAILQTAFVFFASQVLEAATSDSARLVMTGQAQNAGLSQDQFKQEVCKRAYALFDCNAIQVDVRTYDAFSSIDNSNPIDADGNLAITPVFGPGGPGDIVVVRLFYKWPIYTSILGLNLADLSNNRRLLIATAAFRNEPYQKGNSP